MATINTTDPKPGYVYDSNTDTWYPLLGLASQSLDALTDVVITTPATGQILAYNGTQWINQTETGDVTAVTSGTGISVTNSTGPIPSVAVDTAVVATTNNTLTLSNKTISGTSNTITDVAITSGVSGLGTGVATFLATPSSANLISAVTDETGSGSLVFGTSPTITTPTISGGTAASGILIGPEERWNIVASAATGTVNIDALTSAVWYYTSDATGNHTLNFRGSSTTSMNTLLTTGDAITILWLNTNGATAYYPNVYQVDGTTSGVTVNWSGGTAPSSGNVSSLDVYSFTIVKTANATFRVLAAGAVKYA